MDFNVIRVVIGNGFALVATLFEVSSGMVKRRHTSVLLQFLHEFCCATGDIILGGYSGAVVDGVDAVRDLLSLKNWLTQRRKYVLIFMTSTLVFYFNNLGLVGFLPLVATVFYTLTINIKDPVKYKLCLMLTWLLNLVYNLVILSFVGALIQGCAIVGGVISIVRIRSERRLPPDSARAATKS